MSVPRFPWAAGLFYTDVVQAQDGRAKLIWKKLEQ